MNNVVRFFLRQPEMPEHFPGVIIQHPFLGESNKQQIYGDFEGISRIFQCILWVGVRYGSEMSCSLKAEGFVFISDEYATESRNFQTGVVYMCIYSNMMASGRDRNNNIGLWTLRVYLKIGGLLKPLHSF